jgi:hypothetical protein
VPKSDMTWAQSRTNNLYTTYHTTSNGSTASAASAEFQTTRNSSLAAWKAITDPCQPQLVLIPQPVRVPTHDPALRRYAQALNRAIRDLKRELRRAARAQRRDLRKTVAPLPPPQAAQVSPAPQAARTSPALQASHASQAAAPPPPEGGGDSDGGGDQGADGDGDPSHAVGSEPSRSRRSLAFFLLALSVDGASLAPPCSWTPDAHTSLEVRP